MSRTKKSRGFQPAPSPPSRPKAEIFVFAGNSLVLDEWSPLALAPRSASLALKKTFKEDELVTLKVTTATGIVLAMDATVVGVNHDGTVHVWVEAGQVSDLQFDVAPEDLLAPQPHCRSRHQ